MDMVIIIVLSIAVIVAAITLIFQVRSNREAHRTGTGVALPQSWVIITVNILLLVVCVLLLLNILNVLNVP